MISHSQRCFWEGIAKNVISAMLTLITAAVVEFPSRIDVWSNGGPPHPVGRVGLLPGSNALFMTSPVRCLRRGSQIVRAIPRQSYPSAGPYTVEKKALQMQNTL